jgi:outer membrane protein assembly factor BamE (lipoprotein component of BamABCDE complex)
MRSIVNVLAACAVAAVLAGCASAGNRVLQNENTGDVERKIVRGYSTKESVRKFYGDPMNVSFTDSGNELWKYEFSDIQATAASYIPVVNLFSSGVEGYRKELVVFFDRTGVVQNYTLNRSNIDSKSGIVPQ